jgi:hypothetical protein
MESWDTQNAFKWALEQFGIEEFHDVLGCMDCKWEGEEIIYCHQVSSSSALTPSINVPLGVSVVLPLSSLGL